MNRRSSFFISLIIHILLLVFAFILYRAITPSKKEPSRVPIKLSQCVVSSCTCKANESDKKKSKKVEEKFKTKPIAKSIKEQSKVPQEQKNDSAQQKVFTPIIETKTLKEPPKEQPINTQNTPKTAVALEIKTTAAKPQAPKVSGQEYIQTNLVAIIAMLQENFYYPLSARKRGIQGEVVVKFTLCKNRDIKDIKISKDAPAILTKAAINTIESLSGKLPAPTEELVLELPINYKLH